MEFFDEQLVIPISLLFDYYEDIIQEAIGAFQAWVMGLPYLFIKVIFYCLTSPFVSALSFSSISKRITRKNSLIIFYYLTANQLKLSPSYY